MEAKRAACWLVSLALLGWAAAARSTPARAAPAPEGGARCAPWPGEPQPLPTTRAPDSILARWAELRARELARVARDVERGGHQALAQALWEHAACLDPKKREFAERAGRSATIVFHRPEVRYGEPSQGDAGEPPRLDQLLARLDAPIVVAKRPPPSPEAAEAFWASIDQGLAELERALEQARFEEALASARRLRAQVIEFADRPGAARRRVRVEVAAATAALALGDTEAAERAFERALRVDPELELDPARTSPKVIRMLERVRDVMAAPGAETGREP